MRIPGNTRFVLSSALDNVPAGATGQLTRLDYYHVALAFDEHEALVFDVEDTETEVWAAISPVASPSMTDPPMWRQFVSMAITIPIATVLICYAKEGVAFTLVCLFCLGFFRDMFLKKLLRVV